MAFLRELNTLSIYFIYLWLCHMACDLQDPPQPAGMESVPPVLGIPSPNH